MLFCFNTSINIQVLLILWVYFWLNIISMSVCCWFMRNSDWLVLEITIQTQVEVLFPLQSNVCKTFDLVLTITFVLKMLPHTGAACKGWNHIWSGMFPRWWKFRVRRPSRKTSIEPDGQRQLWNVLSSTKYPCWVQRVGWGVGYMSTGSCFKSINPVCVERSDINGAGGKQWFNGRP